ncbi:MAG: DUF2027 domain-containing protein [Bernardetiaceae bacterium]
MTIGTRVRLLHDTSEGIVTRILAKGRIEIETTDGFRFEVLQSELTVIHEEERLFFGDAAPPPPKPIEKPKVDQPIVTGADAYLAFVPFNDQLLQLYLINHSDRLLLYNFGLGTGSDYEGLKADLLAKNKAVALHQFPLAELKTWPPIVLQYLIHDPSQFYQPQQHVLDRFHPKTFFKEKKIAPVIHKSAVIFALEINKREHTLVPLPALTIEKDSLRETILENAGNKAQTHKVPQVPDEIDLHIEKLHANPEQLNKEYILDIQIAHFEKCLDAAIVAGKSQITFIHGVGLGKLKEALQKRLSKNAHVNFYKDAQREKFGYGATLVKLK